MIAQFLGMRAGVSDLFIRGRLRIMLKPLMGQMPVVGAIKVLGPPYMHVIPQQLTPNNHPEWIPKWMPEYHQEGPPKIGVFEGPYFGPIVGPQLPRTLSRLSCFESLVSWCFCAQTVQAAIPVLPIHPSCHVCTAWGGHSPATTLLPCRYPFWSNPGSRMA